MKYRKKSIEVKAVLWDGSTEAWQKLQHELGMTHKDWEPGEMGTNSFFINTSEGRMKASEGDYIIKEPFDKERKFYPCKPHVFEQTYGEVEQYCAQQGRDIGSSFSISELIEAPSITINRSEWGSIDIYARDN